MLNLVKLFLNFLFILILIAFGEPLSAKDLSQVPLSNLYSPHFLRFIQLAYGTEGIISQGGGDSIDVMFSGFDLNGKKILEVGSGFGGVAIYLAQKYDVNIIGVDLEPYMTVYANNLLGAQRNSLKGQVLFQILEEPTVLKEFPSNTFDVVYCKEVLYHVPAKMKQLYINEMYRVLKHEGTIIIADWLKSSPSPGEWLELSLKKGRKEFCHYLMPQELKEILLNAGFRDVNFTDISKDHIKYTQNDIERMENAVSQIDQELGDGTCKSYIEKWNIWLNALESQQLIAGISTGIKKD